MVVVGLVGDEGWPVEPTGGGACWPVWLPGLQTPGGVRSSIGVPGKFGIWEIGTHGGASTVTVITWPVARRTLTVR